VQLLQLELGDELSKLLGEEDNMVAPAAEGCGVVGEQVPSRHKAELVGDLAAPQRPHHQLL
jgi:hypothetical protein